MQAILKILSFVSKNYKALYLIYKVLKSLLNYFKQNKMDGLISKKGEKGFGKFIDDKLKLPVWFEPFDGFLATQAIGMVDNKLSDKVPDNFKIIFTKLNVIFEKYEDTGTLQFKELVTVEELTEVINTLINIPNMTEDEEAIIISGILTGVFQLIKIYATKEE